MSELNPVLVPFKDQRLVNGSKPELPVIPPHGLLVAKKKDGALIALKRASLTMGERIFRPYDNFAVVDGRVLGVAFQLALPSATTPFCFLTTVEIQLRVVEPVVVLSGGIQDMQGFLRGRIQKRLLGLVADMGIESRRTAERECQDSMNAFRASDVGLDIVETSVRVELDAQVNELLKNEFMRGRGDQILNTNQLLDILRTLQEQKLVEARQAKAVLNAWFERTSPQLLKKATARRERFEPPDEVDELPEHTILEGYSDEEDLE